VGTSQGIILPQEDPAQKAKTLLSGKRSFSGKNRYVLEIFRTVSCSGFKIIRAFPPLVYFEDLFILLSICAQKIELIVISLKLNSAKNLLA